MSRNLLGKPIREDAVEEMRVLSTELAHTKTDAVRGYSLKELIQCLRACSASAWDITPDDLPEAHRNYAARTGRLSPSAILWCKKEFG